MRSFILLLSLIFVPLAAETVEPGTKFNDTHGLVLGLCMAACCLSGVSLALSTYDLDLTRRILAAERDLALEAMSADWLKSKDLATMRRPLGAIYLWWVKGYRNKYTTKSHTLEAK